MTTADGNGWIPGRPETHPSITRLSDEEILKRLWSQIATLGTDEMRYGNDPRVDARELLRLDRESVTTYRKAAEMRGLL